MAPPNPTSTSFPAKGLVVPHRPKPFRSISSRLGLSSLRRIDRPTYVALPVHTFQSHAFEPLGSPKSQARFTPVGTYFDVAQDHRADEPPSSPPLPQAHTQSFPSQPSSSSSIASSSLYTPSRAPSSTSSVPALSPLTKPPTPISSSRLRSRSIKADPLPSSPAPSDLPLDHVCSFSTIARSNAARGLPAAVMMAPGSRRRRRGSSALESADMEDMGEAEVGGERGDEQVGAG